MNFVSQLRLVTKWDIFIATYWANNDECKSVINDFSFGHKIVIRARFTHLGRSEKYAEMGPVTLANFKKDEI